MKPGSMALFRGDASIGCTVVVRWEAWSFERLRRLAPPINRSLALRQASGTTRLARAAQVLQCLLRYALRCIIVCSAALAEVSEPHESTWAIAAALTSRKRAQVEGELDKHGHAHSPGFDRCERHTPVGACLPGSRSVPSSRHQIWSGPAGPSP